MVLLAGPVFTRLAGPEDSTASANSTADSSTNDPFNSKSFIKSMAAKAGVFVVST